jgi:hypothetical protein
LLLTRLLGLLLLLWLLWMGLLGLLLLWLLWMGLLDLLLLWLLWMGLLDLLLLWLLSALCVLLRLRPLLRLLRARLRLLPLLLRALLLCPRRGGLLLLLRLGLFLVLLVFLRVRRDNHPEKQKQGRGTGGSNELHRNHPPLLSLSVVHADHQSASDRSPKKAGKRLLARAARKRRHVLAGVSPRDGNGAAARPFFGILLNMCQRHCCLRVGPGLVHRPIRVMGRRVERRQL